MDTRKIMEEFILKYFLKRRKPKDLGDGTSFLESGIIDSVGILELITSSS